MPCIRKSRFGVICRDPSSWLISVYHVSGLRYLASLRKVRIISRDFGVISRFITRLDNKARFIFVQAISLAEPNRTDFILRNRNRTEPNENSTKTEQNRADLFSWNRNQTEPNEIYSKPNRTERNLTKAEPNRVVFGFWLVLKHLYHTQMLSNW